MDRSDNLDNESSTAENSEKGNPEKIDDQTSKVTRVEFEKLKAVHTLHKKKVRKNIHQAMSPISAISGYLELMRVILKNDGDISKLEQYRSKIDQGVSELGEIIEELHEVFNSGNAQLSDKESLLSILETHRRAS